MAKTAKAAIDAGALKALSNPKRLAVLEALIASDGAESSPNRLSEQVGEPLGQIAYHVRQLAEAGLIEEARTQPVRGTLEHFYRPRRGADRVLAAVRDLTDAIAKLGH